MIDRQALYEKQREWSDRFLPRIVEILAPKLIRVATYEQDTKEATDLVVIEGKRIACRIRKPRYYQEYPDEFTIRYPSEFRKIVSGFADWFFYGFADDNGGIQAWRLIDLDVFRLQLKDYELPEIIPNTDGTRFIAFRFDLFSQDPPILIDSYPEKPHELMDPFSFL